MSATRAADLPLVESVLHPTDFSNASERAFAHALAVALVRQTRFTILHVGPGVSNTSWRDFPPVRRTLERWGLLEPGSPRSAVFEKLGMRVEKVAIDRHDPVRGIVDYLKNAPAELVVLATEGREGLPRWIHGSVAEDVARAAGTMTLFVPEGARGFVSLEDGNLSLRRVLVPVAHRPPPDAAIEFSTRIARAIGDGPVEILLLHVGERAWQPDRPLPETESFRFRLATRSGDPVDEIVACAEGLPADLVVMVTEGRNGVLDALRGTTTEQVLRRLRCPMLAVPTAWLQAVAEGRF
jgi:nucleotide-binding universal stress UspA family protein